MKKATLSTTALLSVLALSTVQTSAALLDAQTTPGIGGFVPDTSEQKPWEPEVPGQPDPEEPEGPNVVVPGEKGTLYFNHYPVEFNFGFNAVDASDLLLNSKSFTQKKWIHDYNDADTPDALGTMPGATEYSKDRQHVSVWDGRIVKDDWEVSVQAVPFEDSVIGKTLAGATIKIEGYTTFSHYLDGLTPGDGFLTTPILENPTGDIEIRTDGTTTDITSVITGQKAKDQTDIGWNIDKVTLNVSGGELKLGEYVSAVTWNLVGTPNA